MPSSTPDSADEFDAQLSRTVDLLRAMPVDRLSRVGPDGTSIADRAYALTLELLSKTRELDPRAPQSQPPRLKAHGIGDQVAVIGTEFARAAVTRGDLAAARALDWAADRCRDFRKEL